MVGQSIYKTEYYSKVLKPMRQRIRRTQIRHWMNEITELMAVPLQSVGRDVRKLNQTKLLEAVVQHLQESRPRQLPPSQTAEFRAGYECCASEVFKFMATCGRHDIDLGMNLITHLANKLNEIQPHREDPDIASGSVQPPREAPDIAFGSVQPPREAPDIAFGSVQPPREAPDIAFGSVQPPREAPDFPSGSVQPSVIVHPPAEVRSPVLFHPYTWVNPTVLAYPSGSATSACSCATGIAPRFPMLGTSISTGSDDDDSNSSDDVPQPQDLSMKSAAVPDENSQRPW